jgi:hypothetical protein
MKRHRNFMRKTFNPIAFLFKKSYLLWQEFSFSFLLTTNTCYQVESSESLNLFLTRIFWTFYFSLSLTKTWKATQATHTQNLKHSWSSINRNDLFHSDAPYHTFYRQSKCRESFVTGKVGKDCNARWVWNFDMSLLVCVFDGLCLW